MASSPTRRHVRGERLSRTCVTLKIGYATREAALEACEGAMMAGRVDPGCHITPYLCDDCRRWHTRNRRIVFTERRADLARHDWPRRH